MAVQPNSAERDVKAMIYRTVQVACFAKFFATAALCLMVFTSPALAEAVSYAAPATSSEIAGDLTTKFFTAKIHLVESNNQLMLTQLVRGADNQYAAKPYPIDFSFKGNGWSATLRTPIHMEIRDAYNAEDNYGAVIRADVNFNVTEMGETQTRRGLATVRLQKSAGEGWSDDDTTISLSIVDADDNRITLYNSSHEFAMSAPDGDDMQAVENGDFSVNKRMMNLVNVPLYEAQVYNGRIYAQSSTADTIDDAVVLPAKRGLSPITQISMNFVPAVEPITQISIAPAPMITPAAMPIAQPPLSPAQSLPPSQRPVIPDFSGPSPVITPMAPPSFVPAAQTIIQPVQQKTPDLSDGSFLLRHTQ